MSNTREKLIEILRVPIHPHLDADPVEVVADYLIDNGVTFATDNNDGCKWISVTERLPENFASVLGYMADAGEFPPVRECYTVGNTFFFPALRDIHPVSHWMEMPQPPKEGRR